MNITFRLADLPQVVQQAWNEYKDYTTWAFHAPMGAGKTTFIHALCEHLQITDPVSSPTFALVNEYKSPVTGPVYHMDWYRIKDEEEAIQAGIEDYLYSGNLSLVEWPEKAAGILPSGTLHIQLQVVDSETRTLLITT
ncbi:MAG: tRNA (adenosine(37)-N6)-threonylcarbamoyltransferase complex ATPase subunit type 1 TsaE [Filimonas sp.]|nr:tRNA (adenosine(37)-N6)-threonylcarbamoyltransferase complex ATPase subunit type 1 TsaE [Filimonas sp.]